MKKLLFGCSAFFILLLPSLAQVDHDYNFNDRVPIENASITRDQVPPAVLKAASTQLDLNNPATWSKFPYALKEYGWVYDVGASELALNHYQVTMKTKSGNKFWAIYDAAGNLIETKEASLNIPMPATVKDALANSQYKDWTVVGDKEIIRYFHDHNNTSVEQHFRLTVEKDKVKRSISFNFQAGANK
jgi:hypothetical protein